MPIYTSDYTWHQTDSKILLSLDLHHTSSKNVDIVTTNSYLKVSFLPYIFEVFLRHLIDADRSTARIVDGRLEFDLAKESEVPWSSLCLKLSQEEMQLKRKEVVVDVEKQEAMKLKNKKESKTQRERFAVSQQIEEDNRVREERQKKIEEEKADFMKDSEDKSFKVPESVGNLENQGTRSHLSSTCSEDGLTLASEGDYDGDGEDSHCYSSTEDLLKLGKGRGEKIDTPSRKQQRKNAYGRKGGSKEKRSSEKEPRKEDRKKGSPLPPVRQNGTIQVCYTDRVFPTPMRESRKEEEDEWLASQSTINSSSKESDNAGSCSVDFYKEKAVSLFEAGDYRGCVNAYTEALCLNPNAASLYSNRAAANLALNNLHHAINDCSKALELLTPPTEDNSKSRLLSHIRRGTAFVRLGLYSEGLLDYGAALKLNPEDKNLLKDKQKIQSIMMASTDSGESDGGECEVGD